MRLPKVGILHDRKLHGQYWDEEVEYVGLETCMNDSVIEEVIIGLPERRYWC